MRAKLASSANALYGMATLTPPIGQHQFNLLLALPGARVPTDLRIELLCRRLAGDTLAAEALASDVARMLNISLSRFRHIFKEQTGIPFARYVKLMRLHRARRLLLDSHLRIKEVAANAGFNDVSHFVKDFKSLFGESPTKLRTKETKRHLLNGGPDYKASIASDL